MTRKERREERRKRLRSLILLLFLTIVLLSTSTYAWFTSNRTVNINPIDVNVSTASGLQISTNASEWKTLITTTDITSVTGYQNNLNQLPSLLSPVSTAGLPVSNTGYLDFYIGTVAGDDTNGGAMSLTAVQSQQEIGQSAAAGTSGDFIAFDIFLKVDIASDIYLDLGSGVTVTSNQVDKGLQYASRYAFVIEGTVAGTDSAANAQALHGATAVYVIEPNYDGHTSTGVNNASTYYGISTTAATSGVAAVSYVGVKAAISTPIELHATNTGATYDSNKFAPITNLYRTNVAYSTADASNYAAYKGNTAESHYLNVFSLPAGITKVRVYMWIEGQDVDCENAASGAYLTYKIGLTLDDDE